MKVCIAFALVAVASATEAKEFNNNLAKGTVGQSTGTQQEAFAVQFNKFAVNAQNMDIKPSMTGECRYDTSGGKNSWCCMATAGKSGKSYGQEYCAGENEGEPCVDCVSFWGRKYYFSHFHHRQPVFQQLHYASNDDHFTVTTTYK